MPVHPTMIPPRCPKEGCGADESELYAASKTVKVEGKVVVIRGWQCGRCGHRFRSETEE